MSTQSIKNTRYWTRDWLGRKRVGHAALGLLPQFRHKAVRPETDVVIEGFQRSGNSFFLNYFSYWNPGVTVAHHMHVSQQVVLGVQYKRPTIVLIREPASALASTLSVEPMSIWLAINSYVAFYEMLEPLASKVVIAEFQKVTKHPRSVIEKINLKFGCDFAVGELTDTINDILFSRLRSHHREKKQKSGLISIPTPEKNEKKREVIQKIQTHPKFQVARSVYERMLKL